VPEVTEDQFEEIRDAFELFDQDNTGYIETREFKLAARALGVEASGEELRGMLNTIGADEQGTLSLDDFVVILSSKIPPRDSQAEIAKVFAMFDEEGSGDVTLANLRRISDELGRDMSEEELQDIIHAADRDGDGVLSFEEFFRVLRRRGKAWLGCSDSDGEAPACLKLLGAIHLS
jgi:centrin-1